MKYQIRSDKKTSISGLFADAIHPMECVPKEHVPLGYNNECGKIPESILARKGPVEELS